MAKAIQEATPATVETLEGVPTGNGLAERETRTPKQQGIDDWHVVRAGLLKTAMRRDAQGLKRLDGMCDAVMDKAIAGNMQAVIFIAERIDGKVVQPVDMKQDITVNSVGQAHLEALQRLTDAVSNNAVSTLDTQPAKTIEGEATPDEDSN